MEEKIMPPVHPGEILEEEFLKPLGMTAYQLAKAIVVMPPRVYEIARGECRHRPQAGPLLRHGPGVLDQVSLRPGGSQRQGRREDRAGD